MNERDEFARLAEAVVRRWGAQNGAPELSVAELATFTEQLWSVVADRGLPPPLSPGEVGAPRELTEAECALLVARVVGGTSHPHLPEAARQLIKTCLYPEFTVCRDSYRAVSPDGACRRQDLTRARKRASGSHCVDCPYWLTLSANEHGEMLAANWSEGAVSFDAHREIFLPEDYRALRRWVRRRGAVGN